MAKSKPLVWVSEGSLVKVIFQYFNPWVQQILRLYEGLDYIEVENIVGPIDVSDGLGKEVITKWTTQFNSMGAWFSDSNGQEMQWRQRNYQETYVYQPTTPVASNYYPVNTAVYMNDTKTNARITFVTDRSQGCSSLADGELELMVHRRCLYNDGLGLHEALNDTSQVRVVHRVIIADYNSSSASQRLQAQLLNNPPLLFFTAVPNQTLADWSKNFLPGFSILRQALPANIELLSVQTLASGLVLLRLHHLFGIGEHPQLSQPVDVDLSQLFKSPLTVQTIEETQLTGVRPITDVKRNVWNTAEGQFPTAPAHQIVSMEQPVATLQPMQTRTFLLRLTVQ